jgi:hypothetical protein
MNGFFSTKMVIQKNDPQRYSRLRAFSADRIRAVFSPVGRLKEGSKRDSPNLGVMGGI